jgi:2,3-bisphosphoglycerate-dependent phosphoglycerate mutase
MQKWGNFTDISDNDVPTYVSENLNERYYGKLQGLNKQETIEKYGEKQVHLWRRSYTIAPPGGESEKDVYKRAVPFFKKYIEKDLKNGKNVLVVASHNSLRVVIKYLENISDDKIVDLELPFGAMIKYEFDGKNYTKYNKYY